MNLKEKINYIKNLAKPFDEDDVPACESTIKNAIALATYLYMNVVDSYRIVPSPNGTIYFEFPLEVIEIDNKGILWFSNVDPESSLEIPIFNDWYISKINESIKSK